MTRMVGRRWIISHGRRGGSIPAELAVAGMDNDDVDVVEEALVDSMDNTAVGRASSPGEAMAGIAAVERTRRRQMVDLLHHHCRWYCR